MSKILKKAYAEVYQILNTIEIELSKKIPKELRDFFATQSDKYHVQGLDYSIEDGKLLDETLAIIAFLNLKYWVNDPEEYDKLIKIYKENEEKIREFIGGSSY